MIKNVYSVKDSKAGYDMLYMAENDAIAIRNFEIACNTSDSMFNNFPADFALYKVGEFNTENGSIISSSDFITDALSLLHEV